MLIEIVIDGVKVQLEKVGNKFVKPSILKPWSGYNVSLKPAWEPVLCFRKPVDDTYAHNALTWGCGGLAIDACRVPTDAGDELTPRNNKPGPNGWKNSSGGLVIPSPLGRWPANILHDGSDEVLTEFDKYGESKSAQRTGKRSGGNHRNAYGHFEGQDSVTMGHSDKGTPARFFYCAKASKRERNAGLDDLPERPTHRYGAGISEGIDPDAPALDRNHHPTVKPLALNRYLARLIKPPLPTARLLVPFSGSGSEVIGALMAGWPHVDGIEREQEYIDIAHRRIAHWVAFTESEPVQTSLLNLDPRQELEVA